MNRQYIRQNTLPTATDIDNLMDLFREVMFPIVYSPQPLSSPTPQEGNETGLQTAIAEINAKLRQLAQQVLLVATQADEQDAAAHADVIVQGLLEQLADIRLLLLSDVEAVALNDPAAGSSVEVICCYPAITAMLHHRIAHALHKLGLLGAMGSEAVCFGSESGKLEGLEQLAELLLDPAFNESVRARLAREPNLSYAAARQSEAEAVIGDAAKLLERPNDILAVEYLKAVRTLGLSMRPLPVLRKGSGHDQNAMEGETRSASEIRRRMAAGVSVENDIPAAAYAVYARELEKGRAVLKTAALETAMLSRLLLLSAEDFAALPDAADGLENRLYRAVRENGGLDAILTAAKTRRYALARIRRLCLCACLGVREGMAAGVPPYARVLAADRKGRAWLRQRSGEGEIPLVTKPAAVRALGADSAALFMLGAHAHDLYTLGFGQRDGVLPDEDWRTGPRIV